MDLIQNIRLRVPGDIDPYRTIRLGGFFPLVAIVCFFDMARVEALHFQVIVNAFILSLSAVVFFDFLLVFGVNQRNAYYSLCVLVLSWPFLIMPIYYPLLSDYMAIAVVCLSFWLWARQYKFGLVLISAIATTILPALFLVPLTLVSIPMLAEDENNCAEVERKVNFEWISGYLKFVSRCTIAFIAYKILQAIVSDMPYGLNFLSIKWISGGISVFLLVVFTRRLIRLSASPEFVGRIQFRWFLIASLATGLIQLLLIAYLYRAGNGGAPNLMKNLAHQAVAYPFSPFVSHFLYFGPIFLVGVFVVLCGTSLIKNKKALPLLFIFMLFLPILSLGSESRQWITVFPVIVALMGAVEISRSLRMLLCVSAGVLCLPAFFLASQTKLAVLENKAFSNSSWQFYFGRQGPWMSSSTYVIGLLLAGLFFVAARKMLSSTCRYRE